MSEENELKYYILGLILTDGCVSQQESKMKRMTFRTSDIQLAEMLHPIISPDRKMYENKPYKAEHNISYALINTNPQLLDILDSYGIKPRKSYDVKFPDIPEDFITHFIRGVFDGDGSISKMNISKYKYKRISITSSSFYFISELLKILLRYSFPVKIVKDNRKDAYYLTMYNQKEIERFGEWIYKDCNYCMERKRQRFNGDIV